MSIPGRNDPCPCGSGKKYKQCHLKYNMKSWSVVAEEVDFIHPQKEDIHKTFFLLNDDFKKSPNPGACHLLSSILYVLLKEQGINSDLCIGEVQGPNGFFDHSWIEIEGKVFDLAIQLMYDGTRNAPVYADLDLESGLITKFNYRFKSKGLDSVAEKVYNTPFSDYMDKAEHSLGWGMIERVGRSLGLKLIMADLRDRYKDTRRMLVTP